MTPEELDEKARREEALQRVQYDDDLRRVMGTPAGRRFMFRLIEDTCRLRQPSFAGEDTHQTAMAEGRRYVGSFWDRECMRVCPAEWAAMWQEALESALTAATKLP